jgi:hypothetical protein
MPDGTELHQAEAAFLFQAKWFSTKPRIEALNGTELDRRTLIVNEGLLKNGGHRYRHSDRDLSHSQDRQETRKDSLYIGIQRPNKYLEGSPAVSRWPPPF